MSSVAIIPASIFSPRQQRSQTCRRSGLFAMRCSGLPGKRVEAQRAGMIPAALFIYHFDNDFGRCRQILSNPVGAAAVGHFVESGPKANRTDASVMGTFDVDLLIADQKRTRKIDIMVACGFENHSRRGVSAFLRLSRPVMAKITPRHYVV